ncbi:MAG: hypothetical protein JXR76_20805, partial [Deltaproteobacteria bacterium]|nr:hypothetical protein [Deltaproteobacteria bacterium]
AKHLLICGHTDTAGRESYNEALSQKRANVVSYVMLGDKKSRSMFVVTVNKQHTSEDIQHVLLWLSKVLGVPGANPGKIDGKIGQNTNSAIREIKRYFRSGDFPPPRYDGIFFNDDFHDIRLHLENNTTFGASLWAVVFEIYQAELQVSLRADGFDIHRIRDSLKWVDPDKKAVGCGETWPINARGKDNYKSQANRRVEILFYDPDEITAELPCKEDKCAEDDCHIFKNMDRYNPGEMETNLEACVFLPNVLLKADELLL